MFSTIKTLTIDSKSKMKTEDFITEYQSPLQERRYWLKLRTPITIGLYH